MIFCRLVALFIELFLAGDFVLFFCCCFFIFSFSLFFSMFVYNFLFLSSLIVPVKSFIKLKIVGDSEAFGVTSPPGDTG